MRVRLPATVQGSSATPEAPIVAVAGTPRTAVAPDIVDNARCSSTKAAAPTPGRRGCGGRRRPRRPNDASVSAGLLARFSRGQWLYPGWAGEGNSLPEE
jgi:hypothetical protein